MKSALEAIVMGGSPTGLYCLRELSGHGIKSALVDVSKGCAFSSRHACDSAFVEDGLEAVERRLESIAGDSDFKPLLLPTNDLFIEFVAERAERLRTRFSFAPAFEGVALDLLDKLSFHRLCQAHGIATPSVLSADSREALYQLVDTAPLPCILKPTLIHRAKAYLKGQKVLLVRDKAEFRMHLDRMPDGLGGWLVQEIIPGAESEITLFAGYIDASGAPKQCFTGRKLRQYPPGFGSASLVTSEPCEETLALSLNFLAKIGFRGICGTEFKRDPRDGKLKIIEINPRPTLWFQAAHDAGKRVVAEAWRDLVMGESLDEQQQHGGVCWRYALKDLASAVFYRRHADSFIFPPPNVSSASACSRRSYPVFARDDVGPALSEPLNFVSKAWKRRG